MNDQQIASAMLARSLVRFVELRFEGNFYAAISLFKAIALGGYTEGLDTVLSTRLVGGVRVPDHGLQIGRGGRSS